MGNDHAAPVDRMIDKQTRLQTLFSPQIRWRAVKKASFTYTSKKNRLKFHAGVKSWILNLSSVFLHHLTEHLVYNLNCQKKAAVQHCIDTTYLLVSRLPYNANFSKLKILNFLEILSIVGSRGC